MNKSKFLKTVSAILLMVTFSTDAVADVQLPAIFSDNMVLQRNQSIPIWGWAEPAEKITVSLGKQTKTVVTGGSGVWRLTLDALPAGGPWTMTVSGKNKLIVKNIFVGEVWICSGQSNMAMQVSRCKDFPQEQASAKYPKIRMFTVSRATSVAPAADCNGRWTICSPQTVGGFSATAYFFGRKLHRELGVPVGLINTSWGGTPVEAWTSLQAQKANPAIAPVLMKWSKTIATYNPETVSRTYLARLARWKKAAAKAKADGKRPPRRPRRPVNPKTSQHRPANLFNGMINPLIPYGIRGAIWYQGEHNASREFPHLYQTQLTTMITDWRRRWKQGDFPFLFVQLPNFRTPQKQPVEPSGWVTVREAMLKTLTVPNTGMAITVDIGEAGDIHPKNKQDVGKRLALWALGTTYKKNIVYSGPIAKTHSVKNGRFTISFNHTGDGLKTRDGGEVKGFAIAGPDRKFVIAQAKIENGTVVVWSDAIKKPQAVRYSWAANPNGNLINSAGLPASPFRTDDWKPPRKP
ncbi:MAG: sialate O-acetylesterase [Planctomycetaceae bacterium]